MVGLFLFRFNCKISFPLFVDGKEQSMSITTEQKNNFLFVRFPFDLKNACLTVDTKTDGSVKEQKTTTQGDSRCIMDTRLDV
jgi:hypothetical protein